MDSQGLGDAGLGSTPRSLSRGVARLWGEGCVCGSFRMQTTPQPVSMKTQFPKPRFVRSFHRQKRL